MRGLQPLYMADGVLGPHAIPVGADLAAKLLSLPLGQHPNAAPVLPDGFGSALTACHFWQSPQK